MSTPGLRRRPRLVVTLLLLATAVLALGQAPGMGSWVAVCAIASLVLVAAALVLAVREMVTRGRPTPSSRR